MFFKSQYGFRKNYCILNKIQTNMDKKVYPSCIFYDLKRPLTWWIIMYCYVMFLRRYLSEVERYLGDPDH